MKLITFVGTGEYKELTYTFNKKNSQSKYIQKALVDIFSDEIDSIILCFTKESKVKHETTLLTELKKYNKNIESIITNSSFSEDEIKENFKLLCDKINENEEIIFDITHSFRVIPLTVAIMTLYLKIIKNAKIKKVFYGAAEKLGPISKIDSILIQNRIVPIVDASYLINIFDFSIAVSEFLNTGNPQKLSELTTEELRPLLKENQEAQSFNKYFKEGLLELNNKIATCRIGGKSDRPKNIDSNIEKLSKNKIATGKIPLLDPLIEKINQEFEINETNKYAKILEYCVKYNYIQQGYTILTEIIPTMVLEKIDLKEKINDEKTRDQIKSFIKSLFDKDREYDFSLNDETKEKIKKIKNIEVLGEILKNIEDFRNDINHAGYRDETIIGNERKNLHDYSSLKKNLNELVNQFKIACKETNK